jgi:hypothetical protein
VSNHPQPGDHIAVVLALAAQGVEPVGHMRLDPIRRLTLASSWGSYPVEPNGIEAPVASV